MHLWGAQRQWDIEWMLLVCHWNLAMLKSFIVSEYNVKCRGRNRIIRELNRLFFFLCTFIVIAQYCNWILDTSNRTFNKTHKVASPRLLSPLDTHEWVYTFNWMLLFLLFAKFLFFCTKENEEKLRVGLGMKNSPSERAAINWCDFNQVIFVWRSLCE